MQLSVINANTALHEGELDLRYRVLRKPLAMPRGSEWFEHEERCIHVVLCDEQGVHGCVLFCPDLSGDQNTGGRLLQMAVDDQLQGQGWGRKLVQRLEAEVEGLGFREIVLHARDNAIGFYERLGYTCFGEPYTEVGIPHRNMRKSL